MTAGQQGSHLVWNGTDSDRYQFRERICAHTSMTFDYRTVTLYPSILTCAIRTKPNYEWCLYDPKRSPGMRAQVKCGPCSGPLSECSQPTSAGARTDKADPKVRMLPTAKTALATSACWETTWPRPMAHERVPKGKNVLNLM